MIKAPHYISLNYVAKESFIIVRSGRVIIN